MSVLKLMTPNATSVSLDDTLSKVKAIFDTAHFHHILVVEDHVLCGIISDRDLLKAISHNLGTAAEKISDLACLNKRVHQIMKRHPITVPDSASAIDAIKLFNKEGVSCLPVVNEKKQAIGILTWRDIMKALEETASKKESAQQ